MDSKQLVGKAIIGSKTEPGKSSKTKALTGKFNVGDSLSAMGPAGAEMMYQSTGSPTAAAVLHGAFTGLGASQPYYGSGMGMPGLMGSGKYSYAPGYMGGKYLTGSDGGVAGTGVSTPEMMQSMNQTSQELLVLQANLQQNMQAWNAKSNIISADHRARMAMIEKFTGR